MDSSLNQKQISNTEWMKNWKLKICNTKLWVYFEEVAGQKKETPPFFPEEGEEMGYMMRVRLSSFFAGAAVASGVGFYYLYKDYRIAHDSISRQLKAITESLDARITAMENLKETENATQLERSE